jgi:hypothetical protein
MDNWVNEEFSELDLGDKRVNKNAKKIIDVLALQPGASIPVVFKTWPETKACYEFFHNGKVQTKKILAPHIKATLGRIEKESVVLLPQDTSSLNYTSKPSIKDLGNIGKSNKTKGYFVHPLLAITPFRINLGIIDAKIWTRDLEKKKRTDHEAYALPIEEKETFRWIESYRIACDVAKKCPDTQIIALADRESDFAELFEAVQKAQEGNVKYAHIIVRSCHDRAIEPSLDAIDKRNENSCNEEQKKFEKKLRNKLKLSKSIGEVKFTIPRATSRPARAVTQTLKSAKVTFKKRSTGKNSNYPSVTINAVMAIEENPPEGVEPLIWVFLTTLPVDNFEQVSLVIQYYLCRWEIEVFFKILKSGCNVEDRRLTGGAITPLIAIFMVIAWRIMYAMKMGRSSPEISCETLFSASEWKSVHKILNKEAKLPEQPPSLGVFIKMIGNLGGYLNRKNDPPPGPKAMWIGFNRMHDFAIAWEAFGHS